MPEIKLEHITKRFDKFVAVDDLNMIIEDRDFVTLLGPSGCGKTTTLRMIAGLETPTEGRITIGDTVVFDSETGINIAPGKRDIGFLFQNYALWPHMTVYKNIAFGLENLKWKKEDIAARVDEMCKMLKIEQFKARYPSELSGGQQQRVAIARTLAPSPKVLFMDEPLSNLDAKLRLEMRTELKRLHADTDSTFVYVTHDQLEAMTLATKVCLMSAGVLQQYDPPLTVYNRPNNLFVADFVGNPTMNFIPATATIEGNTAKVEMLGKKFDFVADGEIVLPAPKDVAADGSADDKTATDTAVAVEQSVGESTAPVVAEEQHDNEAATPADNIRAIVVGARPEFIRLEQGELTAKVYATLPAGMETTVKLSVDDEILTSVAFGSVDYRLNDEITYEIVGNGIILFDAETKDKIAMGSLTLEGANAAKAVEEEPKPAKKATKSTGAKGAKTKAAAKKS